MVIIDPKTAKRVGWPSNYAFKKNSEDWIINGTCSLVLEAIPLRDHQSLQRTHPTKESTKTIYYIPIRYTGILDKTGGIGQFQI